MANAALLILDVQKAMLMQVDSPTTFLPQISKTITEARSRGVKIIHITVSFRAGHPECSPRNRTFSKAKAANMFLTGSEEVAEPVEIAPLPEDITMIKKRVSGFCGTDLDVILRSLGIVKVILLGLSTSGAVLSTMKEAVDRDYEVVVLKDLCLDPDPEVQCVVMDKIFPKYTEVVHSDEWLTHL